MGHGGKELLGEDADGEEDRLEVAIGEMDFFALAEAFGFDLVVGVLEGLGGGEFILGDDEVDDQLSIFVEALGRRVSLVADEGLEGDPEAGDGVFEFADDAVVVFELIKFLVDRQFKESLLGFLGGFLVFGGNLTLGLADFDEGEEKVAIVENINGEVEGVVEILAEHEVAGMGLHLLKILVEFDDRHESGGLGAFGVELLGNAIAGGDVEGKHIEMPLEAGHKLGCHLLQIDLAWLAGAGLWLVGLVAHIGKEKE